MPRSPVSVPDEAALPRRATDRRTVRRYQCTRRRPVRLVALPDLRQYQGVLRDASAWGIGVVTREPLAPGTVLTLQPPGLPKGSSRVLTATARHATRQRDGSWLMGCSLSRPLTDEELRALL